MKTSLLVASASLSIALLPRCGAPPAESADLVLVGANVVTMNPKRPSAQAVAVKGDRILAVGSDDEIRRHIGTATQVLELAGKTVVPGMIDSHVHFVSLGSRLLQLDARNVRDKDEILERVSVAASSAQPGAWIQGRGWDQNRWSVKAFPTKEELDAVSSNNPVFLGRVDGHAAWVNSRALEIAGITRDTPDPPGGRIIRYANGEPAGTLVDNAFRLVSQHIPPLSKEERRHAVELAIQECLSDGVTSVHETGGFREDIELYQQMMEANAFNLRIFEFLRWPTDEQKLPHTYESLDYYLDKGRQVGLHGNRLTIGGIKMSVDGALGSRGAAFLEPYADDPGNKGVLRLSEEEIYQTIVRGLHAGFQVTTHAIGDRANRIVLDAMERALEETGAKDARLRIEHAQILAPEDVPRFAKLGIIPSMQPTHCTTDMHWAEDRIGKARTQYAYAWKSLLDTGVRIAGGSDAPVESVAPLPGIYAAVTRQDKEGWPEGGWHPEQRVSREEALRMFTIDAAYSVFEEDIKGSLEPGKLADLVVLSKDILTIPAKEILSTEVEKTILGGKIVFSRDTDASASASAGSGSGSGSDH